MDPDGSKKEITPSLSSDEAATDLAGGGLVRNHAHEFRWYMTGQGLFFLAGSLNFVLVQWLITFYLRQTPEVLGNAQMIMSLPQFLFVLFGGIAAERTEARQHLLRLQCGVMLPPMLLAVAVLTDQISVPVIVAIGVFGATLHAFVQPARDALLTRVSDRVEGMTIQRAVSTANTLQFGTQIVGVLAAGLVKVTGPAPLLFFQCGAIAVAIFSTMRLSPAPPLHTPTSGAPLFSTLAIDLSDGFRAAYRSHYIRPLIIWIFCLGLINMGVYLVQLPIIVRDIYQGGAFELSGVHLFFFIGVTIISMTISRFPAFRHQGRVMMMAQMGSVFAMLVIHFHPPLWIFNAVLFLWGLTGGISMAMSRSIIQEAAPDTHRARILSIFLLAMFGAQPFAATVSGYLVKALGPLDAIGFAAGSTFAIVVTFRLFTNLWNMEH